MSIGYANICSSVQDHRKKFSVPLKHRFWKIKWEQWNQQEGSLKGLKKRGSEDKWSWSADVIKNTSIEAHITRSIFHHMFWRSSEAERIEASRRLFKGFKSRLSLQKTRRMKQRPIQMDLKSLDAYSLKRVEKGQLYELYNHYLHCSVLSLQQDKNNSYADTSVPPDLEWIWNWSFIGQ